MGDEGDWAPHPDAASPRTDSPPVAPGVIVGIGAMCDLDPSRNADDREQSFLVAEFVALADGRRVTLHAERGFTLRSSLGRPARARDETQESLKRDVLNTVLPDDDAADEDHPWVWLATLARARGLPATADSLRGLPYEVVFTGEVMRWLAEG